MAPRNWDQTLECTDINIIITQLAKNIFRCANTYRAWLVVSGIVTHCGSSEIELNANFDAFINCFYNLLASIVMSKSP